MQQLGGRLVLSPTDLTKHLACPHVTTLDLAALAGGTDAPVATSPDDALNLIFAKGLEHEHAYLESLRAQGLSVTEIETRWDDEGRRAAEAETLEAMRAGVDVVYQATLYDGWWGGQADFLLRRERRSDLGAWCYDIADTKLARRLKVPALLQMATYAERLASLQGVEPRELVVVTGDRVSRPWRLVDVAAFGRRARRRLRDAVEHPVPTEGVPVQHCSQCRWATHCRSGWERVDDLSLVAGMRSGHRRALLEAGVATVADLGAARADELPRSIGGPSRERLAQQARLQVRERETGVPAHDLLPMEEGRGLLRLPEPSPGDVYLDFEGDPWAEGGAGREYLAGLWDRDGEFTAFWAHSFEEEGELTRDLLDELAGRLARDPRMHVYHYAAYERTALERLTGRHGTRETELDVLLRGERLVDLYAVVKQGLRISKPSYSIKQLEDFYWGTTRHAEGDGQVADAMTSVVEYERFLLDGDASILDSLGSYNRDDVRSTHDLHAWLEERRAELEALEGPQPRPAPGDGAPSEARSERDEAEIALAASLQEAGWPLLAGLVGWHSREDRPAYWDLFRLEDLDTEALFEDGTALGFREPPVPVHVGDIARSRLWRYEFEPQDCKLAVGKGAHDVDSQQSVGTVHELDAIAGTLTLKIGRTREAAVPRGLGPPGPINSAGLASSIARSAEAVLSGEAAAGSAGGASLAQALLERRVPTGLALEPGESSQEAVVRVGRGLHGTVLAVQGPPGAGKTTVGAALIRSLIDDGLTVGVTAQSHAVIGHLLSAVDRPGVQKCPPESHCGSDLVGQTNSNDDVVTALASGRARLVGGTSWLWSREELAGSVDVLIIDEAGQFALANAVAVAQAARSLVLLGDPQQLTQPTRAAHPHGAGVSTLEHLLDGHDTIPADRGIFLDTTWRLHPEITAFVSSFFYDDRLASAPGRELQSVCAPGLLTGSGLRMVPVEHGENASSSPEEAAVVASLVEGLLQGSWTDVEGVERPLTVHDVLVVAPYNAQVAVLRSVVPDGVRVGTVDRFQGQEAPVVVYSMASSSATDAPRGVDFLYDLHRFNVALSRARALAVVVASPRLLDAEVHHPEQLRAVNALCHFAEVVPPAAGTTRRVATA